MVEKIYIPQKRADQWNEYWQKSNFLRELSLCQTDGLLPIFKKYLSPKQKTLEAGCGLGKWVIYFTKNGYQIEGLDNNRFAVKKAQEYFPKVRIKFGDVCQLPYAENTLDVYLSFGVIEHFEEGPQKALEEAFRVLKPGGTAIIETPYDNPQRIILRYLNWVKKSLKYPLKILVENLGLRKKRELPKMEFYEYHYTKKELEAFIKKAGFIILEWFPKDDLDKHKSLGLWLDFPKLRRQLNLADFNLTKRGQKLKQFYNLLGLSWIYSACHGFVVQKP
ncbi:hypothetical protein A2160_02990 [Candidatus Beckwithbacteria bacterium RBG_13_42_9]|uniref:Methyltransferase type 11 domain-containing protein n=1 Tax=Candidatus Beckwithbacteria bacterium RBG_13_42_9 TaxID=1797457 RepID=A0A1F5E7N5_9BACT|nr:MAG: hypothetical protein A2160_02990 [Candidatus Beckwithbacteria bacterium RBG_13_42_9]